MTIKNTSKVLLGMTCLCGCTSTQQSQKQDAVQQLPENGVITKGVVLNTCDKEEQMYYFEIDTNPNHKGSEFAAVIFSCGAENVNTAQRDFPEGASINLKTSSPRISKLMKISSDGKSTGVIFQKKCAEKLEHNK